MNEQRDTYVPDMSKLQKELGRVPLETTTKSSPQDYAPKKENKAPYISQAIKVIFHAAPRWHNLSVDQQEALDLIATSISFILTEDKPGPYWANVEAQAGGIE